MEMVLNELSIVQAETSHIGSLNAIAFAKTLSAGVQKGYNKVRSDLIESGIILSENYTYYNWLHSNSGDAQIEQIIKPFLYGVLSTPFMDEEDSEAEEQYILSDYYFQDEDTNFPRTRCIGLASAFIANTLSVSFASSDTWTKNILKISVESENGSVYEDVLNVFSSECFGKEQIENHIEYTQELKLIESTEDPNSKKFHLTGHHGQKELKAFWNKLKRSSYVISGLTIEWGGNDFIRSTNANGEIEIVIPNTDRDYAIKVVTTGRNQRETDEIAKILRKNLDK